MASGGVTWENAERANGPAIVAWLEERVDVPPRGESNRGRPSTSKLRLGVEHDNLRRMLSRWRLGHKPSFYTVDGVLHLFGIHPSQVPDDVWEPLRDEVAA